MPNKIRIATNAAPPSIGTHSQAIRTGDLVFLTGQTGRDPETGLLEEGLEAQTRRMLSNIDAVLNAALHDGVAFRHVEGAGLSRVRNVCDFWHGRISHYRLGLRCPG